MENQKPNLKKEENNNNHPVVDFSHFPLRQEEKQEPETEKFSFKNFSPRKVKNYWRMIDKKQRAYLIVIAVALGLTILVLSAPWLSRNLRGSTITPDNFIPAEDL